MDGRVCDQSERFIDSDFHLLFTFHNATDWNSALFIILNGQKEAHLDMLDGGIIQRLLEEKWKTFARVSTGCIESELTFAI